MRRSLAVFLLAAVGALLLFAVPLRAGSIPPNLPPGTQYQLIFATEFGMSPSAVDISAYNDFVQFQAAASSLPAAVWHAVVSTQTVDARDNAPSIGLPVYNTQGDLVASAATGLYTPALLSPILYNQSGEITPFTDGHAVYTGSNTDGTGIPNHELGARFGLDFVEIGRSNLGDSGWINATAELFVEPESIYALSSPITVPAVPEPSSLLLAAIGYILIGWRR